MLQKSFIKMLKKTPEATMGSDKLPYKPISPINISFFSETLSNFSYENKICFKLQITIKTSIFEFNKSSEITFLSRIGFHES